MKKNHYFFVFLLFVTIPFLNNALRGATSNNSQSYITYEQTRSLESESQYVFAMSGIKPNNFNSTVQVALTTLTPDGANVNLDFREFRAEEKESEVNLVWMIEEYQGEYSIRAVDVESSTAYLNITSGSVTLGEKQALTLTFDGDNTLQISRVIDGKRYYVRFTNSFKINGVNTSCFVGGTNSVSSSFKLYKIITNEGESPEPIEACESPIYTIVATSDLHTDYGLQDTPPYVRNGVIETMERIRKEENANVLLLGGDLTSHNATSYAWTKEKYTRAIDKIYTLGRSATISGRVLYATGNHDFAAGGRSYNSGDYTPVMKTDIGDFVDALYQEESPYTHVLGYHYIIDGLDFVVINTAYIGGDNHSNYVYEQKLIDWLDETLNKIGKEKTVFVMGHYPLRDSRNISSAGKGVSNTNNCNANLKDVFVKFENVIYLYGHDHGGYVPKNDTFERITPYNSSGFIINNRNSKPSGFISAFMGSMSYYTGLLSAGQPSIVQALVIYICDDRITFEMKNYGSSHGGAQTLLSYSIKRETSVNSLEENKEGTVKSLLHIYPNPAKHTLNIESTDNTVSINIKNALGRIVKELNLLEGVKKMDISGLNAGIYFVEAHKAVSSEIIKLIVD